ncbi:MAG TPA: arginine--tRNA ligase [Acidimicrobiales bacterium]|nr:arginine--tRNA ligase [Acidimicrobiales bacterium]
MGTETELAESIVRAAGTLGIHLAPEEVHLERPQRAEHGDWSTNVALALAKRAERPPRQLAEQLAAALDADAPRHVAGVEVAGPGFVNFRLDAGWLHDHLREIIRQGEGGYAAVDLGRGARVQIEFVSANPTGPLHVGNGWLGSYGDALARLMSRAGWEVEREYYVNDTGGQVRMLGESLLARRRREQVPDEGYQGQYVADLAEQYDGPDDVMAAGRFATERILASIRETLGRLGISFDEWYSQASIEESGRVADTIELLRERGHVFEQDGAVWLRSTEFGDSRDRVLVKSNGDATYLAGDLAYHRNKYLERGFDLVINVWGADHHGQVASLKAGVQALGIDPDRLEVRLGQLVSLVGGRMSKRSGNYVPLDELIDDLGPDATRLLSLLSSIDQATTLDLDAVKRQSMENPVYYVQYAHARIASIGRVAAERGIERRPIDLVDLSLLSHPRELDVLRVLEELPRVVREAALDRAPYKVTNWVRSLAGSFHGFYHDCYVMGEGVSPELTQARLWLVEAARIGLAIGLGLLGVNAPEQM